MGALPARRVVMGHGQPPDPFRGGFKPTRRTRNRRGIGRVNLTGNHGIPHCAITRKLNALNIGPGEPAAGQYCLGRDIQGWGAQNIRHTF